MDWKQINRPPYRARALGTAIVAVLIGVFLFASCLTLEVEAATLPTYEEEVVPTEPETFSFKAERVAAGTLAKVNRPCWWLPKQATATTIQGRVAYRFRAEYTWCANVAKTQVVDNGFSNICMDLGGFYAYDGCTKQHTTLNWPSVKVVNGWHYYFDIPFGVYTLHEHPSIWVRLYPNGWVEGAISR